MTGYIENIGYFMVMAAFIRMLVPDKFRRDAGFLLGMALLLTVCAPIEKIGSLRTALSFGTGAESTYKADISAENGEKLRENMIAAGMRAELEKKLAEQTGAESAEVKMDGTDICFVRLCGADERARETAAEICGISPEKIEIG